jgi:hypothetical protein
LAHEPSRAPQSRAEEVPEAQEAAHAQNAGEAWPGRAGDFPVLRLASIAVINRENSKERRSCFAF